MNMNRTIIGRKLHIFNRGVTWAPKAIRPRETLQGLRHLYQTAKAEKTFEEVRVIGQCIRLIPSACSNLENSVMGMNGLNASE